MKRVVLSRGLSCTIPAAACAVLVGMAAAYTSMLLVAPASDSSTEPAVNGKQPELTPAHASPEVPSTPPSFEAAFFDTLNRHPDRREAALAGVRSHVVKFPDDARGVLLLGVAHLWVAAEKPPSQDVVYEHLVLARYYLDRAARLDPADDRIPSWLLSAEVSVAQAEGRASDAAAGVARLLAHAEHDPCFHSVAYAINVWDGPRDRAELAQAQRLLEAAAACNTDDPAVRNLERWPHNVEGFLVGLSDVALKRGDRDRALAALITAEAWPGAEAWPHRNEVQERRRNFDARAARFADGDASNDPPFIFERGGPVSCVSCHQGSATPSPSARPMGTQSRADLGRSTPSAQHRAPAGIGHQS